MKFIHDQLNKLRPLFEKGGRLDKLYPLFEAQEGFLFVPPARTRDGAHVRDALDTKRLMTMVIIALIPPLLFGFYNTGYQFYAYQGGATGAAAAGVAKCALVGIRHMLPIIIVSYLVGGLWEVLFAVVRKHEINEGFLVTGLLFPLTLPPTMPLWQVAVGVSFGVVIGKEVFGGTGMNIFNPALVARAFCFLAYPSRISGEEVWRVVGGQAVDGYSGATPLAVAIGHGTSTPVVEVLNQFGAHGQYADYSWWSMFLGRIPGSMGETSALAILLGAIFLIVTGIASWQIMVSCVLGAVATSGIFHHFTTDPSSILALPPQYHLVMGGFAFGTVYMATDPVSAPATTLGKWIYGFFTGAFAIMVRCVNPAYPEGMMLSILFMNAFAPFIDYCVVNRHMARRMRRAQGI